MSVGWVPWVRPWEEQTSEESTKVCGRMCEMVGLIISLLQGDEDALVVDARNDTD